MKKLLIMLFALSLVVSACTTVNVSNGKRIPPGQAKKITGEKSAKNYAPGQQKKK
jgi:hypothetical protein